MEPTANYPSLVSVLTTMDEKFVFLRKRAHKTAVVKIGSPADMADFIGITKTVTAKVNSAEVHRTFNIRLTKIEGFLFEIPSAKEDTLISSVVKDKVRPITYIMLSRSGQRDMSGSVWSCVTIISWNGGGLAASHVVAPNICRQAARNRSIKKSVSGVKSWDTLLVTLRTLRRARKFKGRSFS